MFIKQLLAWVNRLTTTLILNAMNQYNYEKLIKPSFAPIAKLEEILEVKSSAYYPLVYVNTAIRYYIVSCIPPYLVLFVGPHLKRTKVSADTVQML